MSSEKQYGRDIAASFYAHISADEMRVYGNRLIGQLCVEGFCERLMELAWQPPEFLKPGWIAMDLNGKWFWCKNRFTMSDYTGLNAAGIIIDLSHFNWTPPVCTDWKQSLREIRGKE